MRKVEGTKEALGKENGRGNKKGWWDGECKAKKEEVRRALRRWRKGGGGERGVR